MKLVLISLLFIGISSAGIPQGRIHGGSDAEINQFPYQVSILKDNIYYCGGAIIGDKYILTAAQCVVNRKGSGNEP